MSDFQSRFMRRPEDDEVEIISVDDGYDGFDAPAARDLVIRRANSEDLRLFIFDRDHDEEIDISPSQLIPGEYVRETEYGLREGYTLVNDQGRMVHFDTDRQRINLASLNRDATRGFEDDGASTPAKRLH
jgi:hypothetical protein